MTRIFFFPLLISDFQYLEQFDPVYIVSMLFNTLTLKCQQKTKIQLTPSTLSAG